MSNNEPKKIYVTVEDVNGRVQLANPSESDKGPGDRVPYILASEYWKLRKALVGLVGTDDKAELEEMEAGVRLSPVADKDRADALNAIHALMEVI